MSGHSATAGLGSSAPRRLVGLTVGDRPRAWRSLGFDVDGDRMTVGGVTIELVGDDGDRGLLAWSLDPPVDGGVDGLVHRHAPDPVAERAHCNGVAAVDHVVVGTPHVRRTLDALAAVDLEPRRTVEGLRGGDQAYAFLLLGTCVLEVIGPREHDPGHPPAPSAFVGLAFVARDLDAIGALDGVAGEPRDAIQPGRRIVTLRTAEHGVSVPVALLTPRPRRGDPRNADGGSVPVPDPSGGSDDQ